MTKCRECNHQQRPDGSCENKACSRYSKFGYGQEVLEKKLRDKSDNDKDRQDFLDKCTIAAMQGLLSCEVFMQEIDETSKEKNMTQEEEKIVHPKVLAKTAWIIATAMAEERERRR